MLRDITLPWLPLVTIRASSIQTRPCYPCGSDLDTGFFHTDMKVLADHFHGQPTVLYCVPTNPGPRSFYAWAVRRCHWPVPQPIVRLLLFPASLSPRTRTQYLEIWTPESFSDRPRSPLARSYPELFRVCVTVECLIGKQKSVC